MPGAKFGGGAAGEQNFEKGKIAVANAGNKIWWGRQVGSKFLIRKRRFPRTED